MCAFVLADAASGRGESREGGDSGRGRACGKSRVASQGAVASSVAGQGAVASSVASQGAGRSAMVMAMAASEEQIAAVIETATTLQKEIYQRLHKLSHCSACVCAHTPLLSLSNTHSPASGAFREASAVMRQFDRARILLREKHE
jgi:hypothetical protein